MVSKKKIQIMKEVKAQLEEYPVVGILNMHKLPARQLHEIRKKLRGKAVIRMIKKRLISRALQEQKLSVLESYIQQEPALFLSKEDPFKIAHILQASTSEATAKPGDIAPKDLVVKEGPTNLPPGPAIGELQKAKIPAGVEGEKIVVKKDTVVVKEGEVIEQAVADIISKLGMKPMEIGLNLLVAWEAGIVYEKDILFVPEGYHINQMKQASSQALNLSVSIGYITSQTLPLLLTKSHAEALALAQKANIISPATIVPLLARAHAEVRAVEKKSK